MRPTPTGTADAQGYKMALQVPLIAALISPASQSTTKDSQVFHFYSVSPRAHRVQPLLQARQEIRVYSCFLKDY
jgi:hypothetical protein